MNRLRFPEEVGHRKMLVCFVILALGDEFGQHYHISLFMISET